MDKTFVSIDIWQLVGFLLSFLGVCWGFGKMLLTQFTAQQDERQKLQDKLSERIDKLTQEFAEQKAVLPEKYVLREDYIRNQAVLEAKMDSIQKTLTELFRLESAKSK